MNIKFSMEKPPIEFPRNFVDIKNHLKSNDCKQINYGKNAHDFA